MKFPCTLKLIGQFFFNTITIMIIVIVIIIFVIINSIVMRYPGSPAKEAVEGNKANETAAPSVRFPA